MRLTSCVIECFAIRLFQAESCVIMRPFIYKLTKSELHAVMTGGFATVAGSYIALLVEVGVNRPFTYLSIR